MTCISSTLLKHRTFQDHAFRFIYQTFAIIWYYFAMFGKSQHTGSIVYDLILFCIIWENPTVSTSTQPYHTGLCSFQMLTHSLTDWLTWLTHSLSDINSVKPSLKPRNIPYITIIILFVYNLIFLITLVCMLWSVNCSGILQELQ